MAIETKKIIEISTAGAVSSVKELKDEINSLRDAWLNAEEGSEEYEAITSQLIEDQKKLNDVMRIGKNEASAATGSYNSLVNQMSALKVAWRSTTSEIQRAQLGEKIRDINDQLKAYDESIGNHQRKVGSYEQALQALTKTYDSQKQELAALKTALDNLEPGTDAYNKAFERAAELTHNLHEKQEMLRMSANDLGTQLSNVANIGAGLVGGFNAINAIMTLSGQKNEDLQKTMVKLQAGIALVQGLKGIEGAIKSLKGYANWAAKVYDKIESWISSNKTLTKSIEGSTVATEANEAANTANAAAEKSAAAGANQLSAGMKSTAASTAVATGEMVAFKAVIMSLGIGVIIALISGLVLGINKLIHASDEAYNKSLEHARTQLDLENALLELKDKAQEEAWAIEEAAGENSIALAKKKYDYYSKRVKTYEKELEGIASAEESWAGKVHKAMPWGKATQAIKQIEKQSTLEFATIQAELESMADSGNRYIMGLGEDTLATFKRIREEGLKTAKDVYLIFDMYTKASAQQVQQDTENMSKYLNDLKVKATSTLKTAEDAIKSESQLENDQYTASVNALNDYYDTISADTETRNSGLRTLERAHQKKMHDIVTGATQSIIDAAHQANQTELQNLEEKYQKELKILKKFGKDTTELTKAYEKDRANIILNQNITNTENAIKELERFNSVYTDIERSYDMMVAAGVMSQKDLANAHKASMEVQYQETAFILEQTLSYWENIYKEIENDTNISADKRLEIWNKYIDAKAALEENETKHTLDQIKVRKEALAAEIEEIKKKYDADARANTKANARQDKDSATGWGGFWNTWAGNVQNPSFAQQQQNIEIKFQMDLDSLNEQYDAYQKVIDDMNVTDAERTAAMEQQAEIRNQIMDLSTQKAIDSANIQIDKQKELINTIVDVGQSIGDILGSVADAWESNVQRQIKAGKMSEEEGEKEMEKIRALQIVQATINMLAGSFGAFAQASETIPPPYGQIVGGVAAAAVIAAGIAQIAAIRAAGENSSAGATSTMMGQVTPVMTDYQPQMTGILTGEQETEKLANAMSGVNLWVSVTDIDNAQEKGRVRVSESTF